MNDKYPGNENEEDPSQRVLLLTVCLKQFGSEVAFNYAKELFNQTKYTPESAMRFVTNKLLQEEDEDLHELAFNYFQWEACHAPDMDTVYMLTASAAYKMNSGNRMLLGMQELSAAFDYYDGAWSYYRNNDIPFEQWEEPYVKMLNETLAVCNEDRDLIADTLRRVCMTLQPRILELAFDLDQKTDVDDQRLEVDKALSLISSAVDGEYDISARIARDRIKDDSLRQSAEKTHLSRLLIKALEESDFDTVGKVLIENDSAIGIEVWQKIKMLYGMGQYDRVWAKYFLDTLGTAKPDFFQNLSEDPECDLGYGMSVGYVIGITTHYDLVKELFNEGFDENDVTVAMAIDMARAFGECEDYEGMAMLLKTVHFSDEVKESLIEVFKIGEDSPHHTKGVY